MNHFFLCLLAFWRFEKFPDDANVLIGLLVEKFPVANVLIGL